MIQLTSCGVSVTSTPSHLAPLREYYEHDNYLILPRLFEPSLRKLSKEASRDIAGTESGVTTPGLQGDR